MDQANIFLLYHGKPKQQTFCVLGQDTRTYHFEEDAEFIAQSCVAVRGSRVSTTNQGQGCTHWSVYGGRPFHGSTPRERFFREEEVLP